VRAKRLAAGSIVTLMPPWETVGDSLIVETLNMAR
jgi:hypothetical protein